MKKKMLVTLLSGLFVIIGGASIGLTANANSVYDEFDRVFQNTLTEVLEYEKSNNTNITAEKDLLYDIDLNALGVLYTFTYNGQNCFAIVIHNGIAPTVTEISLDSSSPYIEDSRVKIYVASNTYWQYDGSNYYESISGLPVSDAALLKVRDNAYFGALELYYDSENVNYAYRTENKYNILSSIPSYFYGLSNGCVPVTATNLVAYYDKTYNNLIPNYEAGTTFLGVYRYKGSNDTTNALSETLHADMGTNSITDGTTIPQFKSGLKKYVERNGYSVSYQSLVSWGNLDYSAVKSNVQNSKAIALFLSGFRSTVITNSDGYDVLNYEYAHQKHAATGFGALEVMYTLSNGSNRTDSYIHCAMGVGMYKTAYINIATNKIDEALVVNLS